MYTEEQLEQIHNIESRISEYACMLRHELEELYAIVDDEECNEEYDEYFTPSDELLDHYDIEDLAIEVEEIETKFFKD